MVQSSDLPLVQTPAPSPLEIPELLEMIMDNLLRNDTTSTARVCRIWSDPSLDRIWRDMNSLVPLFSLVRPMALQPGGDWVFTEDVKDADWFRYAVYAPRIRKLSIFDPYSKARLSILAVRSILAHLPPHLQLPRPVSLTFLTVAQLLAPQLELPLISQSLRSLVLIDVRPLNDRTSTTFTSSLQDASRLLQPCLEEFEFRCTSSVEASVEALNACLIKHRSRIWRLKLETPFDGRVWASVLSLSALQELKIAPLAVDELGSLEGVIPMVQALVKGQPQLKLLELDLPLRGEPFQSDSGAGYSRIIRDLMGLQTLETLRLYVTLPLFLTKSEVQKMGVSWPKMRILQLYSMSRGTLFPETEIAPQSDLSLLPCFLRRLPRLELLRVPLTCDESLAAPQEGRAESALQTLDMELCPEPKASLEQVVAYLAAVLPHTAQIPPLGRTNGQEGFWTKVARSLSDLRNAAKAKNI